jgi:hypothetical protein
MPPTTPMPTVRRRRTGSGATASPPVVPTSPTPAPVGGADGRAARPVEQRATDHRRHRRQQGDGDADLERGRDLRGRRAGGQAADRRRGEEGRRDRPDGQPREQPQVHGAPAQVHRPGEGLHDQAGDQVAGDGGEGWYAEDQHEQGRKQGAPAHSGEADEEPDEGARGGELWFEGHEISMRGVGQRARG